jgi:tRNA dimethylallyltransferase
MMLNKTKRLIVIAGPTAIGKTEFAIKLAQHLKTEIISADSRQFFKELNIGTAKPSAKELSVMKHHFVGSHSIHDYYNVAQFEIDVLRLLDVLFEKYNQVILVGGSGLYIDAVCNGIDELPDVDEKLRQELNEIYEDEGIVAIQQNLKALDPEFYDTIDKSNPKRIIRALEVCIATGKKYSEQRLNVHKKRAFEVVKLGLNIEREQLYQRINERVDQMVADGLIKEAKRLFEFKHLNALNTVGYKEIFDHFSGEITLEEAIEKIKTNSRRYAKRQLTWFRKNDSYQWFNPNEIEKVKALVKRC